jgi:hypothetical protein
MNFMKRGIRFFVMMALIFSFTLTGAQDKVDQGRMDRDIEVEYTEHTHQAAI